METQDTRRPSRRAPTSIYLSILEETLLATLAILDGRSRGAMMRELIREEAKRRGLDASDHPDRRP